MLQVSSEQQIPIKTNYLQTLFKSSIPTTGLIIIQSRLSIEGIDIPLFCHI